MCGLRSVTGWRSILVSCTFPLRQGIVHVSATLVQLQHDMCCMHAALNANNRESAAWLQSMGCDLRAWHAE